LPIEDQKKLKLSVRMADNKNTETMLTTGKFDAVNTYTEESAKWYFTNT
jgi:dsDNA-binding SOS-regulon protein